MTIIAALFRVFGLKTFENILPVSEPNEIIQKIVKSILFLVEDIFVYKMLTRRGWLVCFILSCGHLVLSGFCPSNISWIVDMAVLFLLSVLFRRKWSTIIDFLFLYTLMTLYGLLTIFAKVGSVSVADRVSFYVNVITAIDYKLFVITLYLYTLMKGGIKPWQKAKFAFLNPRKL